MKILLKKIIRKLLKKNNASELEYLESHGFRHGSNFNFYSGSPIDSNWPWLITVGNDVVLASDCKILAHDASTARVIGKTKIGCVIIGNNVFIGAKSVVLCNTKIGDNVIVGANSVVTKDLQSNGVYTGNPAKYICSFEEYKNKHENNLKKRPYFNQRPWHTWRDAKSEEWDLMREKLKDTWGYV